MKKTCGALVIGLLITTNVYAKQKEEHSFCKEQGMPAIMQALVSKGKDKNWKPTEDQCELLFRVLKITFNNGELSGRSQVQEINNCPPCPSCDCQKSFEEKQLDKYQEENDRLQRDQMYYEYGRRQK